MGRSNDALRKANDGIRDFIAQVGQEVVDILATADPSESMSTAHTDKYPLNGLNKLSVYLGCNGADIVDTDTLTFKFYIREAVNDVDSFLEINQTANYTVTTTGVTAGEIKRFEIEDTDDIIKNATHYSVASTGTIDTPANCYAVLFVGKYYNVGSDVNIEGVSTTDGNLNVLEGANEISSVPAPIDVTETAQNITLVKAEIKNTGSNIIYIRDSATVPTPADNQDYPIYPGETMGLLTGVYSIVCGAGLTSTLNIIELV
jgi:hypothetical protein